MAKFNFNLVLPNGGCINEKTVIRRKFKGVTASVNATIGDESALKDLIFSQWCKENQVKSAQQWVDELNEDKNFSGSFELDNALDNVSNLFILNINKKAVKLSEFMHDLFITK